MWFCSTELDIFAATDLTDEGSGPLGLSKKSKKSKKKDKKSKSKNAGDDGVDEDDDTKLVVSALTASNALQRAGAPPDAPVLPLLPIWQMARAALGAPQWFKPAQIVLPGGRQQVFVDGTVVCASPALATMTELDIMYRMSKFL